ncbi:TetR/AcrR family transcriptional regulator [Amedibacillus sp. YH-ame6]
MPLKSYSKEQREELKIQLLENALSLYSKHGIKNVRLMDILKTVGISKPFFYTFYDSVQDFVIQVIDFQWRKIDAIVETLINSKGYTPEEKMRKLLYQVLNYKDHGLLVMTQEEEVWVRERIRDEEYITFMESQINFFEKLLVMCEVAQEKINVKAFGNMIITTILIHNSAKKSLPFIYLDVLDETADLQIESLLTYLNTLKG